MKTRSKSARFVNSAVNPSSRALSSMRSTLLSTAIRRVFAPFSLAKMRSVSLSMPLAASMITR